MLLLGSETMSARNDVGMDRPTDGAWNHIVTA